MTTRVRFDIHVNSRSTGIVHAADCVVEEDAGFMRRLDFRYASGYLDNPGRFPLDPARLPLGPHEARFRWPRRRARGHRRPPAGRLGPAGCWRRLRTTGTGDG